MTGLMSLLLVATGIYLLSSMSETNKLLNTNLDLAKVFSRTAGDADSSGFLSARNGKLPSDSVSNGSEVNNISSLFLALTLLFS